MSETKDPMKHESLAAALAAFQAELPRVEKKNKANAGKYSYDYAGLDDISAKVLPLLGKHGLAWTTRPTMTENGFILVYELTHESGEKIEGVYPLPSANTPAQQLGGSITYARRYALCAVTGVAPGGDDHDMQAAQQPQQAAQEAINPPVGWRDEIDRLSTGKDVQEFWRTANQSGWLIEEVQVAITERFNALKAAHERGES